MQSRDIVFFRKKQTKNIEVSYEFKSLVSGVWSCPSGILSSRCCLFVCCCSKETNGARGRKKEVDEEEALCVVHFESLLHCKNHETTRYNKIIIIILLKNDSRKPDESWQDSEVEPEDRVAATRKAISLYETWPNKKWMQKNI